MAIAARLGTSDADPADRRRSPRQPRAIDAQLRPLGDDGAAAVVRNLSAQGFMAQTDLDLPVGTRIWLMIPGLERANAVVRWIGQGCVGAEFSTLPDWPDLAQLR